MPKTLWQIMAAIVVLFLHRADAFLNPQFWAEDFLFLVDAEKFGAATFLQARGGYLHLFPRTVAFVATWLDPVLQPGFYLLGSLAVILAVLRACLSSRLDLPCKPWLALSILIVPHSGEVFLNPTNVQWIAALALILTALKNDPATRRDWAVDLGFLLGAGLSGPFVIFVLPVFAVRAWQRRSRASCVLLAACAIPALIQAWFVLHAPPDNEFVGPFSFMALVTTMVFRISGSLFLGMFAGDHPGKVATTLVGLAALGFLLAAVYRCRPHRRQLALLWLFMLVLVGSAALRKRFDLWGAVDLNSGDRYFFIPKIILLWTLGIVAAGEQRRAIKWTCGALLLSSVVLNAPRFRFVPFEDLHWYAHCPAIRRGDLVELKINPDWKFRYRRGSFETSGPL